MPEEKLLLIRERNNLLLFNEAYTRVNEHFPDIG